MQKRSVHIVILQKFYFKLKSDSNLAKMKVDDNDDDDDDDDWLILASCFHTAKKKFSVVSFNQTNIFL